MRKRDSLALRQDSISLREPPLGVPKLEDITAIDNPTEYVDRRSGRWLAEFEVIKDYCYESGNLELARAMLLDLLKMTKVGRPKADVGVSPIGEVDLSHLTPEQLEKIIGQGGGGEGR